VHDADADADADDDDDAVQSEDVNDEVDEEIKDDVVISRQFTPSRLSATDTSRCLYGSSVYSEVSVGSVSLVSERVVRSPLHGGSVYCTTAHTSQSSSSSSSSNVCICVRVCGCDKLLASFMKRSW